WTSTGTGPFTVNYFDGTATRTATGVVSGTPFSVFTNPVTSTTTYTLSSVQDANCTRLTGFTQGSATITVNTPPSFGISGCPGEQMAYTDAGVCSAVVTYNAVATGSPAPSYSFSFSGSTTGSGTGTGSGSTFNEGNTEVTVTATNICSPPATCTFTV